MHSSLAPLSLGSSCRTVTTVKEQDTAFENRGTTALVYDQTYVRHWDKWSGPKKPSLFSVGLKKADNGKWVLQDKYIAPLKGFDHVRNLRASDYF